MIRQAHHKLREDIIIAGFGGQGVIFASKVAAWAGLFDGKWIIQRPSYGPEMRGGTANGTTIISSSEIYSPVFRNPSAVIIMNEPSIKKFVEDMPKELKEENKKDIPAEFRVKVQGLAIINTSMVKRKPKRKGIEIVEIKATEIAEKLGSAKIANMVALGAYLEKRKILKWESVFKGLEYFLSKAGKNKFFDINKKALEAGAKVVK